MITDSFTSEQVNLSKYHLLLLVRDSDNQMAWKGHEGHDGWSMFAVGKLPV